MSSPEPSEPLKRLVNYILNVFLPVFLDVKKYGSFEYGPRHLLTEIQLVNNHCTEEEKDVLHPIISWNGFFAHQENVQVCLLCSSVREDRVLAVETILRVRQKGEVVWERRKGEPKRGQGMRGIRPFRVPEINFQANHVSELSDLYSSLTEAPITLKMTDAEIRALAFTPLNLEGLPCTTLACERGVQVTTSSAMTCSDLQLQDGSSFNKEAARERNKDAEHKIWNL